MNIGFDRFPSGLMPSFCFRISLGSARSIHGQIPAENWLGITLATKWTLKDYSFFTTLVASTNRPSAHEPNRNGKQGIVRQTFILFNFWEVIMNYGIIQVRVALIVAALIASLDSSSVAADEAGSSTDAKDPCALALVPHEGTDKLDLEIIRLQTKVRSASDPTVWLEQLGWAFVAKARRSFDPGYYKLA